MAIGTSEAILGSLNIGLGALATSQEIDNIKADTRTARQIADFNRRVASENKLAALKTSEIAAGDIRRDTDRVISSHRAAFGASNIVTTSGSALAAQIEQRGLGEEAAQRALLAGRQQAAQFTIREQLAGFESTIAQQRGKASSRSALLSGLAGATGTGFHFFRRR